MLPWAAAAALLAAGLMLLEPRSAALGLMLLTGAAAVAGAAARPALLLPTLLAVAALDVMGRVAEVGGATITLYQLVVLFTVIVAMWVVARLRPEISVGWADLGIALFVAAALASMPSATEPRTALVASASLISSVLLVYLIKVLGRRPDDLRTALVGLLFVAALLGVFAVAERVGIFSLQGAYTTWADGARARVTFKDPNILGGVLAAATVPGMLLVLSARTWLRRLVLLAAVGAAGAGMLATLSRGAWLGFMFGAVIAVAFAPIRTRFKLALYAGGVAAVFALATIVLDPAWVATKIVGIFDNQSALYRVYLARSAVRIWLDNPLGIGPGNWSAVYVAYRNAFVPPTLLESHNSYLTVLAETGIIGLLGFVSTLAIWAFRTVRACLRGPVAHRWLATAALAGGSVLAVQAFTYSIETSKFWWFFIGLGLTVASLPVHDNEEHA